MITPPASKAVWAVVPTKRFDRAKSRLASVTALGAWRDLAVAMLADILDALRGTTALKGVVVVTADAEAAVMARARDFEAIGDPGEAGVNAALSTGLTYAQSRRGAALVTPADIPLVTTVELGEAIDALDTTPVGIAPAARDSGTNLLALARADLITTSFGRDSATHHAANACPRRIEPAFLTLADATRDNRYARRSRRSPPDRREVDARTSRVVPITYPASQVERARNDDFLPGRVPAGQQAWP